MSARGRGASLCEPLNVPFVADDPAVVFIDETDGADESLVVQLAEDLPTLAAIGGAANLGDVLVVIEEEQMAELGVGEVQVLYGAGFSVAWILRCPGFAAIGG